MVFCILIYLVLVLIYLVLFFPFAFYTRLRSFEYCCNKECSTAVCCAVSHIIIKPTSGLACSANNKVGVL